MPRRSRVAKKGSPQDALYFISALKCAMYNHSPDTPMLYCDSLKATGRRTTPRSASARQWTALYPYS
eukprot:scaffold7595_cov267-Pinguiococcus_pyrenoidosus.AAC.20